MSKYAMYRRRGSSPAGESTAPALPAVPLTILADTILDWTGYAGPDPDHWFITLNTVFWNDAGGSDRQYLGATDPGDYQVVGRTSDDTDVTQLSNIVTQ